MIIERKDEYENIIGEDEVFSMETLFARILNNLQKEIDYLECKAKDPVAVKWMRRAKQIVERGF